MKIFRLFITFILSLVFVSCDSIERDVDGNGHNSAYDAQGDNIDEDSFNLDDYSDDNSGQSGGKANNTKKSFTVSFYDEEDTLLDSDTFQYMTKPKYYGVKPARDVFAFDNGLKKPKYDFAGWSEDKMADSSKAIATEKLPAVTKDTDYYAIFSTLFVTYSVAFKDGETTIAGPFLVKEGSKPTYDEKLPYKDIEKTDDGKYKLFSFMGWSTNPEANSQDEIIKDDFPEVNADTTYYAIFDETIIDELITVEIDKEEVELDCGKERLVKKEISTETAFEKEENVTLTYSALSTEFSLDFMKVKWSVDDTDYFSVTSDDSIPGKSVATVTAIKESCLSTLTASLVLKNNEDFIFSTKTCEIRSVMTNISAVGDFEESFKEFGKVVSDYGKGYFAGMGKREYSYSEDIVFPSKINFGGVAKPLLSISFLGVIKKNSEGTADVFWSGINLLCRNLYVPSSVREIKWKVFEYLSFGESIPDATGKKVIFQRSEHSMISIRPVNLNGGHNQTDIYNCIQVLNVTFPYNMYYKESFSGWATNKFSKLNSTICYSNLDYKFLFVRT